MTTETETITGADLERAYRSGWVARIQHQKRNPPQGGDADLDMALSWTCGWDAAESRIVAEGGEAWAGETI